jgi:hypothetical protein
VGRIYLVVKGGLGNQLYQAALGLALERRLGLEVRYILDAFENDRYGRSYLLNRFPGLRIRTAPLAEAAGTPMINGDGLDFEGLINRLEGQPAVILDGWWQSTRFFLGEEAAVRAALTLVPDDRLRALGDELAAAGAIGAHVRRAEYGHFGLVKAAFYRDAIAQIRAERGERRVIFFTDEPNVCRALFWNMPDMAIATGSAANPLADFYLLSRCAHFVIANSTFSWWAAWLGAGAQSIVHAPSPWNIHPITDPCPPHWRRTPDALISP